MRENLGLKVLLLVAIAVSSGCAVKSREFIPKSDLDRVWQKRLDVLMSIERWRFEGRIAVANSDDSWSASLMWAESPPTQEVRVIAPLGQGSAILRRMDDGVMELSLSTGEVFLAQDANELLHRQLDWYLPVESLAYWIKGVPDPNYKYVWEISPEGSLSRIDQEGWSVEYKSYHFAEYYGVDLPAKLVLKNADWRIKLVVQDWQDPQK